MAGSAHLPQNWRKNPAGGVTRYDNLSASMWRGLKRVREWTIERFEQIPRNKIEINALHINQEYYEYLIDVAQLEAIVAEIRERFEQEVPAEKTVSAVAAAYEAGTAAAVVNLAAISDDYTREITQVLSSDPWQRRVALVRSRVFEEMRGFQEDTARDLSRVLSQAVENGESPLETTKTIKQRFAESRSRAERIARTEITNALRRARADEARSARDDLGINVRMLWLSALSPTTRATHAAQHGEVMTIEEVNEWYASHRASRINCKCAQVEIVVDEGGNPVTPGVVEKVRREKRQEDSP